MLSSRCVLILLLLVFEWSSIWAYLRLCTLSSARLARFIWRNDGSTRQFVFIIVGENVVLLRINDSFNNFPCVITLCLKDLANYIHNLWANRRTSHENTLYNGSCDLL